MTTILGIVRHNVPLAVLALYASSKVHALFSACNCMPNNVITSGACASTPSCPDADISAIVRYAVGCIPT